MIRIGISPCFMYPDLERTVFGAKSLTYVENDMVRFVSRKGVLPILIPELSDDLLSDFLDEVDGIVLQGGSDVSPSSYGEELIEDGRWPGDKVRDDYELKIIGLAIKKKKPILGICRGFQLLNVYFGGKLYQDLDIQLKTDVVHRDAIKYDKIYHDVEVKAGGILSDIYSNKKTIRVNTVHHQGIMHLGEGLIVEAISPRDQLIEAFSRDDEYFIFAVQWHPEFSPTLKGIIEDSEGIFDKLLEVIKRK